MKLKKFLSASGAALCTLACGTSCVYINEEVGSNFIPTDQRYDIYIDEFPITGIGMLPVKELSGYSSSRITIGAVMDENGNIGTRSSAFTLIPASKYDFGEGGEVARFHFAIARDTLSYLNEGQKRILQDVNIYSLVNPIEDSDGYISSELERGEMIADVATYDGGDSLSFDFRKEWADRFLARLQEMEESAYDSTGAFTRDVFPGIYMSVDDPVSTGGRINMFELTTGANLTNYSLSGGYATLTVQNARFGDRTVADTTFMFLYGAQDFSITQAASDYYSGETLTPQYALNISASTLDGQGTDHATDRIIVDGGGGLKPVISARGLRDGLISRLEERGIDPADVVINKASIILPFDLGTSYETIDNMYPAILSPACRITDTSDDDEEVITYAGITDSSSSSENQGDINRSTFDYSPDISYHMQQILGLEDYDQNDEEIVKSYQEKDIWLMTMAVEQTEEEQEGTSEYAQNLQYAMYYNNLYNYGYGYGGYGYGYGYGYGGYGYNNYYDYLALASLYSMQGSSSEDNTTTVLDRDRYYNVVLRGPQADGSQDENLSLAEKRVPYMRVTYSVRH